MKNIKYKKLLIFTILIALFFGYKFMKNIEEEREQEELLTTIQPGIEMYFEKYYDNVDPKTIKTHIWINEAMGIPHVEGTVNNNRNLDFAFTIEPIENELGFKVTSEVTSNELDEMAKPEYSIFNKNSKEMLTPTQLLLQKMEDEKAKSKESKK